MFHFFRSMGIAYQKQMRIYSMYRCTLNQLVIFCSRESLLKKNLSNWAIFPLNMYKERWNILLYHAVLYYSYPSVCIKRCDPVLCARPDSESILPSFFNDLQARIPSLCGTKLTCSNNALFTETKALTAAEMVIISKTFSYNL